MTAKELIKEPQKILQNRGGKIRYSAAAGTIRTSLTRLVVVEKIEWKALL